MDYKLKYLKYKAKYLKLKEQIGGAKLCLIKELMENENYAIECKNVLDVKGSCGEPSFDDGLKAKISDETKDLYFELFEIIKQHENKPKNIVFIVGATSNFVQTFFPNNETLIIGITPIHNWEIFSNVINELKVHENLNNIMKKINSYFPLNHIDLNSKIILDEIIKLSNEFNIGIINRMCGTCHRSFYYLLKQNENIKYQTSPEQGISKIQDTNDIQNCFNHLLDNDYKKLGYKMFRIFKDDSKDGEVITY